MFKGGFKKTGGSPWRLLVIPAVIILVTAIVLSGCSSTKSPEVYKLKFSTPYIEVEPPALYNLHICDLIEEKTNGRVQIERFSAGTMGNVLEHLGLVSSGAVDMISLHVDQYPQELPLHRVLNMEVMADRQTALDNIIKITQDISETKKLLDAEMEKNNIHTLTWMTMGPTGILTKNPTTSLEDLKGTKINVITAYQRYIFEELGMNPVNVAIPELYEGMMRGVIDNIWMATSASIPLKWYEVAKTNLVIGELNALSQPMAINLDTWNSLPKDIQQAFIDASNETAEWSVTNDKEMIDGTFAVFKENGVGVVELSDDDVVKFYQILAKYSLEDWEKLCADAGLSSEADTIYKYWQDMMWGK